MTKPSNQGACVYFITTSSLKPYVKIGRTNNIKKRIRQLQVGNPLKIRLIGIINCSCKKISAKLERELHNKLSYKNKSGEWFFLENKDYSKLLECTNIENYYDISKSLRKKMLG